MKLLVATRLTQGARENDFCWTDVGEPLLHIQVEFMPPGGSWPAGTPICPQEEIDGPCGCKRAFIGLLTHRCTTTAIVAEHPFTAAAMRQLLVEYYSHAWTYPLEIAEELADEVIDEVVEMLEGVPVGTVFEKRGEFCYVRNDKGVGR